jgi:hypothetical protein
MNSLLRPSTLDEVLLRHFPQGKRHDVVINPEGGLFQARNLATAIRRSGRNDVIHVPTGDYSGLELERALEIRSLQNGPVRVKGPLKVKAEGLVTLSGLIISAEAGTRAMEIEKGIVVLDDCTIQGEVFIDGAEVFIRNCLIGNADEGIVVENFASLEMSTSRITGCRVGVALRPTSSGTLLHNCFEACVSVSGADPGAAIGAEQAKVYCEGVTFSRNGVGAYLRSCDDARLIACHFQASETAAIVSTAEPNTPALQIHSCTIDGQASARCAQISLTGGVAVIRQTTVASSPAPALGVEQTRLEARDCRFFSTEEPACDLHACHVTAERLEIRSDRSAALVAAECQGLVRDCRLSGRPPFSVADSLQLRFELCETGDEAPLPPRETTPRPEPHSIDEVIDRLHNAVSQEVVRNEIERILRLAHAGQQRSLEGLPIPSQTYHSIFMGPHGTGKFAAAQLLAHGLHAFGVLPTETVREFSPRHGVNGSGALPKGLVYVNAREASGETPEDALAIGVIEELITRNEDIVVLDGERDELRRLLRQSSVLDRAFRHTVFFTSFGPLELAAIFIQLCDRDRIRVSIAASRTILLAFHLYCERKDRRYANTHGVEMLYETTRRRYLERCSLARNVNLELEPRDIDIPQDKSLLTALERCPAFVSFCPACQKENTWLPGQEIQVTCLHCESTYTARWGVWKDSATYRRMRETLSQRSQAAQVQRTMLPPAR